VIRLGVRLALRGGRSGIVRVALIAIALAIGVVTLIVATWTVTAGVSRAQAFSGLPFGPLEGTMLELQGAAPGSGRPYVLWSSSDLAVPGARTIVAEAIAPSGPGAPHPPGLHRLPAPGTALVSPALRDVLARSGGTSLRRAIGARVVGTLPSQLLHDPRQLVVLRGYDLATLRRLDPGANSVQTFRTIQRPTARLAVLSVTALAVLLLLLPLLVFVVSAARLGARRREQRLAVMRLVGATPGQARSLVTVETTTAGVIGTVLGVLGALAVRGWLVRRGSYFGSELSTSPARLGLLALAVPVVATASAPLALRRVGLSPLGVEPRARRRALSAWRWWLFTLGWTSLALGGLLDAAGADTQLRAIALVVGVVGVGLGLIGAGAWLVQRVARAIVARAERPALLLAARRLADDPRAGFRPMAVFVVSVYAITLLLVTIPTGQRTSRSTNALEALRGAAYPDVSIRPTFMGSSVANLAGTPQRLAHVRGVRGTAAIQGFARAQDPFSLNEPLAYLPSFGRVVVADCSTFAATLHRSASGCTPGILVARGAHVRPGGALQLIPVYSGGSGVVPPALPPAPIELRVRGTLDLLDRSGLVALVPPSLAPPALSDPKQTSMVWVGTDGAGATGVAIRDALLQSELAVDAQSGESLVPRVIGFHGYRWLLYGVLAFVILLAACSLAVTVVDQIYDRRRSLATLRALGTPPSVLRQATMIEIAAPLGLATLLGALNGTLMGIIFVVADGNAVTVPWLDVVLVPALVAGAWVVVTAIAVTALGRAAPPVPLRTT
jgi:FtsX-like permease family protein